MSNYNQMTMDELAEFAVTLDGWEWMTGMLGYRDGSVWVRIISNTQRAIRPDLTDPATLGCVLAMVRAKWGHRFYVRPSKGNPKHWCAVCQDDERLIWVADGYPTEAHALIAALAKEES